MSAKWIRSQQWDREHIPRWAWPVALLLRAFSSIPLAVVLLSLVIIYAVLASVPIGLLALAPTYAFYGLTLVTTIGIMAGVSAAVAVKTARWLGMPRSWRIALGTVVLIALGVVAWWVWWRRVWPGLHYDPATHRGVRFFAEFVQRYSAVTLRRLPAFEMTELEFYAWWPLRLVLLMFVLNLIVATVRRIEFDLPHLGVLTVHTGIVLIALGSLYYTGLKLEGDTLLWAGEPGPDGQPTPGPPQGGFYDNTRVAVWVRMGDGPWEQRPLAERRPLVGAVFPRYNDYGLDVAGSRTAARQVGRDSVVASDPGRTLDVPVEPVPGRASRLDPDVRLRAVGYAAYAQPVEDFVPADPWPDETPNPLRFVHVRGRFRDAAGAQRRSDFSLYLLPDVPAHRLGEFKDSDGSPVFAIEYTRGMPPWRWADLTTDLPPGTRHALAVEVPGAGGGFRAVYPVTPGAEIDVGSTGYRLRVREIHPVPPMPIITAGYRGTTSSVVVVRVLPPAGPAFDRWVYHRFPEISQDLLDEVNERGMPRRREADPAIRLGYIDASLVQVYVDEQADGSVRACVRLPGGALRVVAPVSSDGLIPQIIPKRDDRDPDVDLELGERWPHARRIERPAVVPEAMRERSEVGTHQRAMLAVEVTAGESFRTVVWLPFTRYLDAGLGTERTVSLPGGRTLTLAFGRVMHAFPDFFLQMMDFRMVAYDHRGAPRDFQSLIRVVPRHDGLGPPPFHAYVHAVSLNAPLQAPFMWLEDRPWLENLWRTLVSRLNPRQFKLSQAGWDAQGWERTQAAADRGELPRPYASFTILGVGNNAGIHIIAAGAILVSVGIPWAFYIKPVILRRRARRLRQAAAGTRPHPPTLPASEGTDQMSPPSRAAPIGSTTV